ncbi:MAG: glycosyl transferase group 1 [Verrucomicrobia bacterium]|nr:glycosyl transferase group 1 [Verrucomicrobiota bacterium]
MVQAMVEGLRGDREIEILHVNPQLSRDAADIGRWRPGKFVRLLAACGQALRLRLRHGPCFFYYVPAPGKRGALYRDWTVILLCRPFFRGLVLHWHAVGLGTWLQTSATAPERWITRWLLGRAELSLVLDAELAADAKLLAPRRIEVVPNGVGDPLPFAPPSAPRPAGRCEVRFIGLGSREKGLLDTLAAVEIQQAREPGSVHLVVAGSFASAPDERAFRERISRLDRGLVEHAGVVDENGKRALFSSADLFCFPTRYPHEGQPLSLIEAMAHDVPIVTTRWRAIPNMLPADFVWYVDADQPGQIAEIISARRRTGAPHGLLRAHYLAHFTLERHLAALRSALRSLG